MARKRSCPRLRSRECRNLCVDLGRSQSDALGIMPDVSTVYVSLMGEALWEGS